MAFKSSLFDPYFFEIGNALFIKCLPSYFTGRILSAGGIGAIFIFVSCPIQFLLQRLLQNLRKVDVAFKSSGVEPCRKSDRTVYSFIYI